MHFPIDIVKDAAYSPDGGVWYNMTQMSHWAEEYEATMRFLDDQKAPKNDSLGKTYSLVGRILALKRKSKHGQST